MSLHRAEHQVRIEASREECFRTITDYETFPAWQQAVKTVEILERGDDGLGQVVEYVVDAKFREVGYRLRYHYERPRRIWWEFLKGDGVSRIEGEYTFDAHPDGGTLATYSLGIDPGVPVPGIVARKINSTVMRGAAEDLKAEAERRASAVR